jgi:hypothetical protein
MNAETNIINTLCDEWGIEKSKILQTANRFFIDYKKFSARIKKLDQNVLEYQIKYLISDDKINVGYHISDYENPSIYFTFMNNYVEQLSNKKKGIIFFNEDFIYGVLGDKTLLNESEFKKFLDGLKKTDLELKYKSQDSISVGKKKITNVYQFTVFHKFNVQVVSDFFNKKEFQKI